MGTQVETSGEDNAVGMDAPMGVLTRACHHHEVNAEHENTRNINAVDAHAV